LEKTNQMQHVNILLIHFFLLAVFLIYRAFLLVLHFRTLLQLQRTQLQALLLAAQLLNRDTAKRSYC